MSLRFAETILSYYPPAQAIAGCLLCTGSYVGFLLVWKGLPRNHPRTIKRRMLSVVATCSISWIPLYIAEPQKWHILETLGISLTGFPATSIRALVLTSSLFLGPLVYRMADPVTHHHIRTSFQCVASEVVKLLNLVPASQRQPPHPSFNAHKDAATTSYHDAAEMTSGHRSLVLLRNLAVAPIAEEFVFRACMLPLIELKGISRTTAVFTTPLFFGLAHFIHLHELTQYQGMSLKQALPPVLFQFLYTTVFGWYESALFLATKSLVPPILVHSFCNWMGVPDMRRMKQVAGGSSRLPLLLTAIGVVLFSVLLHSMLIRDLYI
ncbi:hypothetical protein CEUSTIGMA_g6185.t1 [Chlamydomonas eustigma]|uniref:intramembrane prenyl-peptidase Rce1 n=1 Tax=Chlamydomonas eustigma TaxID=1157962 RepID=A0A250X6P3_9CHLO|nr:hypothetical protein CEUSTIGMA_g6185.t1 [Chlamydomonas eustigma]|eukprot:GAX78748.1 hypothetical protein CEUSTIGMA_g6185.t1 [Chlamydomonas eustigma]